MIYSRCFFGRIGLNVLFFKNKWLSVLEEIVLYCRIYCLEVWKRKRKIIEILETRFKIFYVVFGIIEGNVVWGVFEDFVGTI